MNILWFSWKDIRHPIAGGAETVSYELMLHLVKAGHKVRLVTAAYPNTTPTDTIDGIEVIRVGGQYTVYLMAWRYYRQNLKGWADLVVDEMNTIPFGCAWYIKEPTILLTYQLARKVWFYQMFFPLSIVGYLLEPLYLRLLARTYKTVLTESDSTRQDLLRHGFSEKAVHVFRVGTYLKPIKKLTTKNSYAHVLILGAIRPMKRTLHGVKAFELARDQNSELHLTIAGDDSGSYARKVKSYIAESRHKTAITTLGRVTAKKRLSLMKDASVIVVTSVKEGWGLIVTEANTQGTPGLAYDVDGLRDSIRVNKTGMLATSGDTKALAKSLLQLVSDVPRYHQLRKTAWQDSKQYTFEHSYQDFVKIVSKYCGQILS